MIQNSVKPRIEQGDVLDFPIGFTLKEALRHHSTIFTYPHSCNLLIVKDLLILL
jgi:hypothetical protein